MSVSRSWSTSGVDLHLQLADSTGRRSGLEQALRDAIRAGRLAPSARLPSSRSLAAQTGLSRGTVQSAYEQLVAEGYLLTRRGSGTEVAGLARHEPTPARHPALPLPGRSAVRHDLRPVVLTCPASRPRPG